MVFDAHITHLSKKVLDILREAYIIPIAIPSHTSTEIQVGDLGVNARLDQKYKKAYTRELAVKKDQFSDFRPG